MTHLQLSVLDCMYATDAPRAKLPFSDDLNCGKRWGFHVTLVV